MTIDAASVKADPSAKDCRVLVVDDNVDSAQSMSLLLGLEGYQVECAYDGEQALQRAERFLPHVVLLDLGLPRFSGYEVARRLRGEGGIGADPSLLLVAVSGYGRERDRQAAREAGFDLHLTKPADPDDVLRVLADRKALRDATLGRAAHALAVRSVGTFAAGAMPHGDPAPGGASPPKPDSPDTAADA